MVTSSKFLSDTILYVRGLLRDNLNDPVAAKRKANEEYVMTSYPSRGVQYPIITIKDTNNSDGGRLGMQSEIHLVRIQLEIRIWARNIKEKDNLFDDVYTVLRTNQTGDSDSSIDNELYDFKLLSVVNVDEAGDGGIKSKLIEVEYSHVTDN